MPDEIRIGYTWLMSKDYTPQQSKAIDRYQRAVRDARRAAPNTPEQIAAGAEYALAMMKLEKLGFTFGQTDRFREEALSSMSTRDSDTSLSTDPENY